MISTKFICKYLNIRYKLSDSEYANNDISARKYTSSGKHNFVKGTHELHILRRNLKDILYSNIAPRLHVLLFMIEEILRRKLREKYLSKREHRMPRFEVL